MTDAQIIEWARLNDCLPEVADYSDYDPDVGLVEPRWLVHPIIRRLLAASPPAAAQEAQVTAAPRVPQYWFSDDLSGPAPADTALQRFVQDNEPADGEQTKEFREALQAVIDEVWSAALTQPAIAPVPAALRASVNEARPAVPAADLPALPEPAGWRITDGEGGFNYSDESPDEFQRAWSGRYKREHEPLFTAAQMRAYAATPTPDYSEDEWDWADLLAAAEAITEEQYEDLLTQPALPAVAGGGDGSVDQAPALRGESVAADVASADARDAARLDWLMHQLSGYEMRRIGINVSSGGLHWGRKAIDAAMTAQASAGGGKA